MGNRAHVLLFTLIAPFYDVAFKSQLKSYRKLLKEHRSLLGKGIRSVLDIGCGTGALALAFSELGYEVTAVDASAAMVMIARHNLRGSGVSVVQGDFFEKLPFEDSSFDLLVASYVTHGHKREGREKFYKESRRICNKEVLIHEFFPNRNPLISTVEFFERSDYRKFVPKAFEELKEYFPVVDRRRLSSSTGWYICRCE
ncbi:MULTISPECIES: class I SAM-dependent methyltransferase [Mesotoga]|jgi:ubiquinone/menaquinone biosynthesis C-methylase UbiE|uniref:class I SAM-dependent methyltransferase n=1 Tax=Mesotoga TaxID=1184396 RepID=UPI0002CC4C20|nr:MULTISPECIES: class I SAM-dependent methyltransferase [Mesotoga]MCP5456895.1 class I SAM-dependent methyltransferase [Thermotogota bacterium]CCU86007.1 Methyltransferase type 11 [Mesotoga infera]MCB1223599.1 class I SAM-dependent methyltransferase [Mesotoga sp.]MCP5461072.1 class I SAM-dependent methyltransferase [Thermotogota bacterium]PIJ62267.1 methylase [Mesotoga sp. H07.pep.5.3]